MPDLAASTPAPAPETPAAAAPARPPASKKTNYYPFWSPRFWHGMRVGDWFRLLASGHFRLHYHRWVMAAIITQITPINSILYRIQEWRHGKRIRATKIDRPPLFIIGHWRSGTTYLHELAVCDEQFGYPTTYECFAPWHFVLTGTTLPKLMGILLPKKRPMDNMAAGMHLPQEDEFALLAMGAPTPYLRMAFPGDPPQRMEFLDMEGVAEADLRRWREAIYWYAQALTYAKQKRLVLKSPPHTGRIAELSRLFPGARFLHVTRDPYALFPSMRRTWKALDHAEAFQFPKYEHLDEYIFTCLERMYGGFWKQREQLDPRHIYDVRYEDLVRDPVGEMEKAYAHLELGDFGPVREKMAEHVRAKQDYAVNRHELPPELKAEIRRRWAAYFERYGYE